MCYASDPKEANMAETAISEEVEEEREPQAQWERAECTCPDWCERDHELD
jgi:hypothetical protein